MGFDVILRAYGVNSEYRAVTLDILDDILDYIQYNVLPNQPASHRVSFIEGTTINTFNISRSNRRFIREILEVAGYRPT